MAQLEADYLLKGRLANPQSSSEIVLGGALASSLQVDPGSTVYSLASGTLGSGATEFKVVGLLDLPDKTIEGYIAYTSLIASQELAAPERISRYEIYFPQLKRLDAEFDLASVLLRLKTAFPQLAVLSWREANPELAAYLALLEPYIGIFAVIFFLLAGLLVVNTLYLSVLERTKEFGVMIALGASRWAILRMVMAESLVLVGLGGLIGASLGVGLVHWMGQGFSLPGRLAEIYQNFGLPRVLYASITPRQLFMVVVSIISTSTVAAMWPTWLAGRLQPVEAMRITT